MNRSARDVWFFSRDGQQSGPLTYRDLKEKADEGVLRPRTDLIWKEGMAEWRPIGEIEGLFERQPLVKPEPAAEPYKGGAVAQDPAQPGGSTADPGLWPGVRRRLFLPGVFLFPTLWVFGLGFVPGLVGARLDPALMEKILLAANLVPLLVVFYLVVQRFANLGMSRWWFLGGVIPFLNIWLKYRLISCPAGYAVHKKMDGPGIFLAILYWSLVSLVVVAFVVVALTMAGSLGSPEQQEQLKKIFEQWNAEMRSAAAGAGK